MTVKEFFNKPFLKFRKLASDKGYIDRTSMIEHLNMIMGTKDKYLCVTAETSSGKTGMSDMIYTYYSDTIDTDNIFNKLYVSKSDLYARHLNCHNVIYITLRPSNHGKNAYDKFICKIEENIIKDLERTYKDVKITYNNTLRNNLNKIYLRTGEKFIILIDEWDYILRDDNFSKENKKSYFQFLSELTDDTNYLELAYLTGKKPISYYTDEYLDYFNEFTFNTGESTSEDEEIIDEDNMEEDIEDIEDNDNELSSEDNMDGTDNIEDSGTDSKEEALGEEIFDEVIQEDADNYNESNNHDVVVGF